MRAGEHKVARAYVLYREEHARKRRQEATDEPPRLHMTRTDGEQVPLDESLLRRVLHHACHELADTDPERVAREAWRNLYDGVTEQEVHKALILSARSLIEQEPAYGHVAARLLQHQLNGEALRFLDFPYDGAPGADPGYTDYFARYIRRGVELELLDEQLLTFDLERLAEALMPERDLQFNYLGLQTLYDRYLQHWDGTRFELPQAFFMRVAMGLTLQEVEREERAIEFYRLLSSFDFMSSTPRCSIAAPAARSSPAAT